MHVHSLTPLPFSSVINMWSNLDFTPPCICIYLCITPRGTQFFNGLSQSRGCAITYDIPKTPGISRTHIRFSNMMITHNPQKKSLTLRYEDCNYIEERLPRTTERRYGRCRNTMTITREGDKRNKMAITRLKRQQQLSYSYAIIRQICIFKRWILIDTNKRTDEQGEKF